MDTSKTFSSAAHGNADAAETLDRLVMAAGLATAHTGPQR